MIIILGSDGTTNFTLETRLTKAYCGGGGRGGLSSVSSPSVGSCLQDFGMRKKWLQSETSEEPRVHGYWMEEGREIISVCTDTIQSLSQ